MIIFAVLVGLLYLRLNAKPWNDVTVVNDRIGAFFFIVLNQIFGNLSAVDVFIKQKALFMYVSPCMSMQGTFCLGGG